jgi:hypothetical protein
MAELVDSVLLSLKSGSPALTNDSQRQRLGSLLVRIAEPQNADLTSNLLGILVRDATKPGFDPIRLGSELLKPEVGGESINGLEILASILEQERVGMLNKMGGR